MYFVTLLFQYVTWLVYCFVCFDIVALQFCCWSYYKNKLLLSYEINDNIHNGCKPYSPNVSSDHCLYSTSLDTSFTASHITSIPSVASSKKFIRYLCDKWKIAILGRNVTD